MALPDWFWAEPERPQKPKNLPFTYKDLIIWPLDKTIVAHESIVDETLYNQCVEAFKSVELADVEFPWTYSSAMLASTLRTDWRVRRGNITKRHITVPWRKP